MKNVDIDEIDKLPGIPIKGNDTFCFRCHPEVSCFNRCCRNLNLFLYPYDVVRLKQCLGLTSDEFLDEYEAWITDYLDLLEMFKKNPTDPGLSQKYMTITQEASTWTQQWIKFAECSEKEEYQERFDEISEMVDKKMEELDMN